jgi:hypothetical protein
MVNIWLMMVNYLVGGQTTPLKNDGVKVSWDDDIPNIWKNKKCSKPPSSYCIFLLLLLVRENLYHLSDVHYNWGRDSNIPMW